MEDIFSEEKKIIEQAEVLLASNYFKEDEAIQKYTELLEEYKRFLNQTIKMMKMSDKMQLELRGISERLEAASRTDALTGIFNRGYFNEIYLKEWSNAVRTQSFLSLIMIDIDFFKKYNDTYGHLQGDECLKKVSSAILGAVKRPRDIVARFGGEEFVVLLPETELEGASVVAEKILWQVGQLALKHEKSKYKRVTVSSGVAAIKPDEHKDMIAFLNKVDETLYAAKEDGRNCIKLYDESMDL